MEIGERIPGLSDKELEAFHANAVRLAASGSVKQREQAETLLPLLGAALQERAAANAVALTQQRLDAAERRAQTRAAAKAARG